MATVTGYTAAKMDSIVGATVVSAVVNGIGHLILTKQNGTTVDAGSVIGPAGPAGTDAIALRNIGELAIAVWELEAKVLAQDNGMADWLGEPFVPGINHVASRTLNANGYPVLGILRDPDRDQGYMGIDDLVPFGRYKFAPIESLTNGVVGSYGGVLSPDKKWLAVVQTTSLRIYPVNATGDVVTNSVAPTITTLPFTAAGPASWGNPDAIKFTPDGKAIIIMVTSSPFILAYAFNTTTGVVGALAANPAVLMAQTGYQFSINANSSYVAIAGGENAAPYFTVYAYNSTTNTWGAKSAAPASPPAAVTNGIAFDDAGTSLIISTNTPLLASYAFNAGTGAIGARSDAAGTLTGLMGFVQKAGKVIARTGSTSPYICGYNLTAGVWSAQWAAPASLPVAHVVTGGVALFQINNDATAVIISDGSSNTTPQAYVLNASSFGAKVTPTNIPTAGILGGGLVWAIPWPFEVQSDFLLFSTGAAVQISIWGDVTGTTLLTGQMTTITKTMPASCQSVYIVDSFSKSSINVTRQYDVSLDGGTTWNNNVPVGSVVLLPTPGTQLKVRVTITRTATGQTGQIFWFNVWAG